VLAESKARIINTSSVANKFFGRIDMDDLQAERKYSPNKAYGDGKLANILFTRELHRRYSSEGITTAAFHPGGVATNFAEGSTSPMRFAYQSILRKLMLTPEQGADTLIWLAMTQPGVDWVSGEYYVKRKIAKANKQADDAELARQLWERSEDMVKEQLDPTLG
jgi:NAD(P)-dependent dehydrogenase (short-subunit alcohol dehydrogenase family)